MDWTRRGLLHGVAALASLGALPACDPSEISTRADPHPEPALARFLAVCRALTGRIDLDPEHAALILSHLWRWRPSELEELMAQVEAAGALEPAQLDAVIVGEPSRAMAEEILVAWYSGLLDSGRAEVTRKERWCFTFTGALAWRVMPWTSPQTLCAAAPETWGARP